MPFYLSLSYWTYCCNILFPVLVTLFISFTTTKLYSCKAGKFIAQFLCYHFLSLRSLDFWFKRNKELSKASTPKDNPEPYFQDLWELIVFNRVFFFTVFTSCTVSAIIYYENAYYCLLVAMLWMVIFILILQQKTAEKNTLLYDELSGRQVLSVAFACCLNSKIEPDLTVVRVFSFYSLTGMAHLIVLLLISVLKGQSQESLKYFMFFFQVSVSRW